MPRHRLLLLALLTVLLAGLVPSSAAAKYKITLIPPDQEPAPRLDQAAVQVTFEDARADEEGGQEPALLGKVRTNVGIPMGLWADGPGVEQVYPGLVRDALVARGHPVQRDRSLPRVHVVLHRSWIDGYQGYKVKIDLELRVLPAEGEQVLWSREFSATASGAIIFTPRELQKPYSEALDEIVGEVRGALREPEFAAALGQPRSTPATPEPVAATPTASPPTDQRTANKGANQGPLPRAAPSSTPQDRPPAADRPAAATDEAPPRQSFESGDPPAGTPAHVPRLDRPWERVTLVVAATLTADPCRTYNADDDWRGEECYGRVLGGADLVGRTAEGFMLRGDFSMGLGLATDVDLAHESTGSDHEDMLPEFRLRAGFGGGAALVIPDGELRLSVGARYRMQVYDAGWISHFAEHGLEFSSIGSMWLGPEFRVELDAEPPGSPIRLGPRFALAITGRLTWLWSEYALYEDYETHNVLNPGTRISVAPGFAVSLPGGDDGGAYFEIQPVFSTSVFGPGGEDAYRAMTGRSPRATTSGRVLLIFGGQFRGE